ncbi:hypothetical protein Tco_1338118 [Tanacetum coccineum]
MRRYVDDSRSSLSRLRPDAVTKSLTPSPDGSRRRRVMPAAPSPCVVSNTSSRIWCRIGPKRLTVRYGHSEPPTKHLLGHLPVEIKHKAYWALKQCNINLTAAAKNRFMELNELMELRDGALRGDKNFKVGDKVLLFNSRFKMHPGKLKSRWYEPNVVKTVYPYGIVEIIDRNEINFKVNGKRLKKYHDGHIDTEDKEVVEFEEDTTFLDTAYSSLWIRRIGPRCKEIDNVGEYTSVSSDTDLPSWGITLLEAYESEPEAPLSPVHAPEDPEYLAPADDDIAPVEHQPLPTSPISLSLGYMADLEPIEDEFKEDPKMDPVDYATEEEESCDDDEEEGEQLALADSTLFVPDSVPLAEEIKTF